MATRLSSWRSLPVSVRASFVTIILLLLYFGVTSVGRSGDPNGGTANANSLSRAALTTNAVKDSKSKPGLAIEAVRPISAGATNGSDSQIRVQLGEAVAVTYAGKGSGNGLNIVYPSSFTPTGTPTRIPTFTTGTPTTSRRSASYSKGRGPVQDAPTSQPTDPPTPPGPDNYTPLVPNSTPTIYVINVDGRIFYGVSTVFNTGTQTPPAFTQVFPLINFNPPAGYNCNGTIIDANTRPLTDVDERNPCALIPVQATAPPPTPTLLQAGVGVLLGYQMVLSTSIYVSQPADVAFFLHSDDGFVWGVGPLNGVPGNPQPIRISGVYDPPPPPSPTPPPTTTFRNLSIVGRRNAGEWGGGDVTVRFPVAGFYPIEVDNAENADRGLNITLESPINTPILNGPSPTPTTPSTPTVLCSSSSQWCTQISPNSTGDNILNGAVAIAQNDVWAVGGRDVTPTPLSGQSLIEHWDGAAWSITSPVPTVGILNGVAEVSSSELWAVGINGILHYTGGSWTQTSAPNGANGVSAYSANDVWAGGDTNIEHWNGSSWSISTPVPSNSALYGVAAIASTDDVWAVGTSNRPSALIMHRTAGNNWTVEPNPTPVGTTSAVLNSIDYYHSNVIWAVGSYTQGGGRYTLIEYYNYNGTGWHIVSSPNLGVSYNELRHVWVDQQGDVWAVGRYLDYFSDYKTLLVHWNGEQWEQVDTPDPGVESQLVGVTSSAGAHPLSLACGLWAATCHL